MKSLLFLACILTNLCAFAQKDTIGINLPMTPSGVIVYEGIIETPGLTKSDLLNNAKQWFVDYFKSSKEVIQNEDKETGTIIGKGIIPYYYHIKWAGTFTKFDHITIKIDCRDSKFRFKIYDQSINSVEDEGKLNASATPERLITLIYGKKQLGINKADLRTELVGIDKAIKSTINSLNEDMKRKADNF